MARLLVVAVASAPDPVLELALGLAEGSVSGGVCVLGRGVVGRVVADEELVPGKADVDVDPVAVPVTVMVAR
jgi:hypothetical protein